METIRTTYDADPDAFGAGLRQEGGEIVKFYRDKVTGLDFCKIEFPGNKLSVWNQPVREQDKIRFHRQWQAYLEGKEQTAGQIPMATWSDIDEGSRNLYISMGIQTVEQMANIADANMANFPKGHPYARRHREMARETVSQRKHLAGYDKAMEAAEASQSVAAAALEENKALKEQLEELRRRIEQPPANGKDEWPKVEKMAGPKTTYRLSDGQIIEGKKRAQEAQALLDAGD